MNPEWTQKKINPEPDPNHKKPMIQIMKETAYFHAKVETNFQTIMALHIVK